VDAKDVLNMVRSTSIMLFHPYIIN